MPFAAIVTSINAKQSETLKNLQPLKEGEISRNWNFRFLSIFTGLSKIARPIKRDVDRKKKKRHAFSKNVTHIRDRKSVFEAGGHLVIG